MQKQAVWLQTVCPESSAILSQMKLTCLYIIKSTLGKGNGTPLQYSCLENPMDEGVWQAAVHEAAVHEVAKSWTRLTNFTFTFHFHALEKEMATHSSVLAWRIPGTGEPMGCHLWGRTELDTTEATQQQQQSYSTHNKAKNCTEHRKKKQ